jgi:CRP-like cAMP-binding protein
MGILWKSKDRVLHTLDGFSRRLANRSSLSVEDFSAISALPCSYRIVESSELIVDEGGSPRSTCSLVAQGIAVCHKLTAEGGRQIVSLHMSGDLLDLQQSFLSVSDRSIQALTAMEIVDINRQVLRDLIQSRPAVASALCIEGLVEASIAREWILNVGRRDGRTKVAHFLCELIVRMYVCGMIDGHRFRLPLTQEQIADATGLTPVYINRTIKWLASDGMIDHTGRDIVINDWDALCEAGEFDPQYLHLEYLEKPLMVGYKPEPQQSALAGLAAHDAMQSRYLF